MRICIKFCGGCNPKYDRKELIGRLEKNYKHIKVYDYRDCKSCDLMIVLAGCKVSCVDHIDLDAKFGKIVIRELKDYEKVKDVIENSNS